MKLRGDGRVFKRGNSSFFWCEYWLNGKEYRESTKQTDPIAAEKFLRDRQKEVGSAQKGLSEFTTPKMKKETIADLLDALKADFELRGKLSPQNTSGLKIAKEAFGDIRAVAFGPTHVNAYIKEQLAENYANASVNRITGLVEQAFTLAKKEGRINQVPYIKHLSESGNARQGFVTASEFSAIRQNLPADLQDFAAFAFATGWRRGEISGLEWSNVQDSDGMIRLRPDQAKNGHGRSVPVTGELVEIIRRRREARAIEVDGTTQLSGLVFHRRERGRAGRSILEFRKAWASACKKAGCAGILFHDLRRAAVTAMVQAGVPPLVARQISGHKTDSMFARYSIVVEENLADAIATTEAYHAKQIEKRAQKQEQDKKVRSIAK